MTKGEPIEALAEYEDWVDVDVNGIGLASNITRVYDGGWKDKDIRGIVIWGPGSGSNE